MIIFLQVDYTSKDPGYIWVLQIFWKIEKKEIFKTNDGKARQTITFDLFNETFSCFVHKLSKFYQIDSFQKTAIIFLM